MRTGSGTAIVWEHKRAIRMLFVALLCAALPSAAQQQQRPQDLTERSLEDLMNIEVTSVSKREQKLSQTAAAVFVITQEDIRRSGATNIPDLLRMVPGLEVAQINAHTWAISARGFNDRFSNKMLVLIDGRSVYSPLFAGVFWDVQDTLLEDIERIEVIRGPGATLWGANAVNGIINIITKKARDTQGGMVAAGSGNAELGFGAVRFGGKAREKVFYRLLAKYSNLNSRDLPAGGNGHDDSPLAYGGFRMDWQPSEANSFTLEGDMYGGREHELVNSLVSFTVPPFQQTRLDRSEVAGADLLSRWNHTLSGGSELSLQFSFERTNRDDIVFGENRNTYALDLQHHVPLGHRQDFVWGLGYALTSDQLGTRFAVTFRPSSRSDQLFSTFLQDEIRLVQNRLTLTVGSKFEHNDYTGFELEPGARLFWTPHSRHGVWLALSRAVRTPDRAEHTVEFSQRVVPIGGGMIGVLTIVGQPGSVSEELTAREVGYRTQPLASVSFDISAFWNRYTDLSGYSTGAPFPSPGPPPHLVIPAILNNELDGSSHGIEVAANWNVTHYWRLKPGYSWLVEKLQFDAANPNFAPGYSVHDVPRNQFQFRSLLDLPKRTEIDSFFEYVSAIPHQMVSSYTRVDARLGWRPAERLEFSVVLQNAFHSHHQEFGTTELGEQATLVPRSAYAKLTWHF